MTKKIMVFVPTAIATEIHAPAIHYMFQLAYDVQGKYPDQLEWLPSYIWQANKHSIWQAFLDAKPDIVCLSMYLWSADILHYLAKRIREESPETIILLGGPEVDWKEPERFYNQYPYYDYICYGDGELQLYGHPLSLSHATTAALPVRSFISAQSRASVSLQ